MGILIQWFFLLIGCLLMAYCGFLGIFFGTPIIFLFGMCDPEDLEFWKKDEEEEEFLEDY